LTKRDSRKNLSKRKKKSLPLTGKSEIRSFKKQKLWKLKKKEREIEKWQIIINFKLQRNKQNLKMIFEKSKLQQQEPRLFLISKRSIFIPMQRMLLTSGRTKETLNLCYWS